MTIDLDEWQREQSAANRRAADLAMWRLGKRYDWGIRHPLIQQFLIAMGLLTEGFNALGESIVRIVK